jgi:hypothetical protein
VACGAKLVPHAKFCPECGTPVAGGGGGARAQTGARPDRLPWIIAGVAGLALIAVVVVVVGRGAPTAAPAPEAAPAAGGSGMVDLTTMTPREIADRLFNRVMTAKEQGDTATVNFFAPKLLTTFHDISPLSIDDRLHIALVALAMEDAAAATAQADTIARERRTHLFAAAVRAQAADLRGDRAAARAAYRAFLDAYDAERARNLPEYGQHEALLAQVREAAQAAVR